jgi:hypothetical protein
MTEEQREAEPPKGLEEKENEPVESPEAEAPKRIDLNALYPGKEIDLNRLFPDDGTKKLLHDVKRSKREIERIVKNLGIEEE